MKLFDSHAHLDDEQFDSDREEIIDRIIKSDVKRIINVGADIKTSESSIKLASEYDFIYAAVGIHPHDVSDCSQSDMEYLKKLSVHEKVVAIGEIGLDYYYDNSPREEQRIWFENQIQLSEELNLPFIVHSRDASEDTYDIIKRNKNNSEFVLHCFSQSLEMAKKYIDLGGYISFAGPVTYKKSIKLREVVKNIPLDRLLIETDCPYLSPEPKRGKRNDPTNVLFVAETIANELGIDSERLAEITFENASRLFSI